MTRRLAFLGALAALALLLAGCGGGSGSPQVANLGTTATTTTTEGSASDTTGGSSGSTAGPRGAEAQQFSSCMRTHGVPNFPDPDSQGRLTITGGGGINPDSSQFQSAQRKCARYLPNGGQPPSPAQQAKMQAQALKFAACMRAHGVPNFPDPQFQDGGIQIKISAGSGINPRSPQFQAAQRACQSDLPGKAGPGGNGKVTSGGFGTTNVAGNK
jgi:hypothetical protein